MRTIDNTLKKRLNGQAGTFASNAAPAVSLRIARAPFPLHREKHLEHFRIAGSDAPVTDCAVAIEHRQVGKTDGAVWVCSSDGWRLRLYRSESADVPSFSEVSFPGGEVLSASACDIAFDGYTVRNPERETEFLTVGAPYLFRVSPDGELSVRRYGETADTEVVLASGVTKVSAVRAPSPSVLCRDAGFCVFYLTAEGELYYRQKIGGVWCDAVSVPPEEEGLRYADLTAFFTWDYRIGVQAVTEDGAVYTRFSRSDALLRCGEEHLRLSGVSAGAVLEEADIYPGKTAVRIAAAAVFGRCRLAALGIPSMIGAYNASDGIGTELLYPGEETLPAGYEQEYIIPMQE